MTLELYWTILQKRWGLILICFLVVGVGAYIGSKLMTPLYQSSALVQVSIRSSNNNQADYNSLLASDELVGTEAQLATSDTVLRTVASNYPGLTFQALAKEVTAASKLNTQLFEIDVLDASPTRAAELANDIAAVLIKQQLQATQLENSRAQQQLQQDLAATQKQINATDNQIATLQATGGNQSQIAALQVQLNGLQQYYSQWQTALAQLEVAQAQGGNFLFVAQVAVPNPKPVQPNVQINTGVGLLVGLLLGMLLAVLYERLDTRVRTPEALTELLDWPVLSTIWRARSSKKEDVFNPTGHDSYVEGYRILRTNIGFAGIDKPLHSLLVTSAMPNDGKSVIAANLAIFMAKAGKTTLLIDADLRHPSQHELFGLAPDKMGLSNAVLAFSMPKMPQTPPLAASTLDTLNTPSVEFSKPETAASYRPHPTSLLSTTAVNATDVSLEPFIHSAGIPNLRLMPSGPMPPNPPELLDSKAMQRLLTVIANYGVEVVIFDTAPLLGLSDASILVSKVDGTLVVVDITRANKKNLKQIKGLLMQAGAHVLGCVVNKQRSNRKDTPYYSYYFQTDKQNSKGSNSRENGGGPHVPETPAVQTNIPYIAKLDLSERGKGEPYENGN
jgi:non-specific protein-tyrosine kinase